MKAPKVNSEISKRFVNHVLHLIETGVFETRQDAAIFLGIKPQNFSALIGGAQNVQLYMIHKLCRRFNSITIDSIFFADLPNVANFKTNLKTARLKFGLSQAALAKQLETGSTTVNNWERGVSYPNMESFVELCQILEVSPNDLLIENSSKK